MRRRPKRGTKPASRTAARRSRTRRASVRMALISLICVIPTAINWLGLLVRRAECNLVGEGQPPYSLQIWDSQSGGRSRPHFAIWPLSAQPRRPDASWWRTGVHLKEVCGISEITRFAASLGLRLRREERPEPKTMVIVERPTTPKKRTT